MNEKINVKKFKKLAHALRIVSQVMYGLCSVLAGITILANIVFLFLPQSVFSINSHSAANLSLTAGGVLYYKITLAPNTVISIKPVINTISLLVILSAVLVIPVFYQLSMILKSLEQGSPFSSRNAARLNIIGWTIFGGSFLLPLAEAAAGKMVMEMINKPEIFVKYTVVNFTMLLTGFLILILAGIFKYGSYLQQEYDATL